MTLEHSLQRTVLIRATRETVFKFFTDSKRFAAWWGEGSQIDPRPGGAVRIVYPNGAVARGEVIELQAPERVVFSYGYEDPSKPIPPGGSRVTITLSENAAGTLLELVHALPDAATRDMHVPGWRFQLALFANAAAADQHRELGSRIDAWFAAWQGGPLPEVTPDVSLRDAYACISGRQELEEHIRAARQHLPLTLARAGEPRHCQGLVLCDWSATDAQGTVAARGTNLFELAPDGRIHAVTGFWART